MVRICNSLKPAAPVAVPVVPVVLQVVPVVAQVRVQVQLVEPERRPAVVQARAVEIAAAKVDVAAVALEQPALRVVGSSAVKAVDVAPYPAAGLVVEPTVIAVAGVVVTVIGPAGVAVTVIGPAGVTVIGFASTADDARVVPMADVVTARASSFVAAIVAMRTVAGVACATAGVRASTSTTAITTVIADGCVAAPSPRVAACGGAGSVSAGRTTEPRPEQHS